jgi:antagonist of KipI
MTTVFRVERPGPFTTVQDLGRPHYRSSGVSVGGAMDRFALMAGNCLVGNSPGAAGLEILLGGMALTVEAPCLVALTGADLDARVDGQPVPGWTGFELRLSDRLTLGSRRQGARAYLAVSGGVDGDSWLGSFSTNLLVGRGGMGGRPLRAGDEVARARKPGPARVGLTLPVVSRPRYATPTGAALAAVRGPQWARLSRASKALFFGQEYEVGRDSDRMGYRLTGEPLEIGGPELLSFGLAFGVVQVPWGGQPILLMADHQTAGGYPVVAGVVRADLPVAAQLLPGDRLRFGKTTLEEARRRWRALIAGLEELTVAPLGPR